MKAIISLLFLACFPISILVGGAGLAEASDKIEGFKAKSFKSPVREFSVIATDSGYYPNRLFAYVGDTARFFVTSTAQTSQCFLLEDHKIFLAAEKGKMQEGKVEFKYPGRFEYYCPSTKFKGHITVVERPHAKKVMKKAASREIASEVKNYWTPRDYD